MGFRCRWDSVRVLSFLQFPLIRAFVKGRKDIFILLKKLRLTLFIHKLSFLLFADLPNRFSYVNIIMQLLSS